MQWDQDLSRVHELDFWSLLLMEDALLSLDTVGRGLVLTHIGMPGFVDSPREAIPPLGSRWGWDGGR